METVNALKVRNNLGEVLDRLEATGEPILVSKNRKVRAVLITPGDFERRFVDKQSEETRRAMLAKLKQYQVHEGDAGLPVRELRKLRGYED
jgi:prevent-host-death family protein